MGRGTLTNKPTIRFTRRINSPDGSFGGVVSISLQTSYFQKFHGDLLADDIFLLDDGPRVLDCLEFDDSLRLDDVLADVAFLAMDLEFLGHPELAEHFLQTYARLADDDAPASLRDFYIAYRALVRAKVAALTKDFPVYR